MRRIWIGLIGGAVLAFLLILPGALVSLEVPIGRFVLLASASVPLLFPGYAACALFRANSNFVVYFASWLFYALFFGAIVFGLSLAPRWLRFTVVGLVILLTLPILASVMWLTPEIGALSFNEDGSLLAVTVNGRVDFLDTLRWERIRECKTGAFELTSVSFPPSGGWFVTSSDVGTSVWDESSCRKLKSLGRARVATLSSDGATLAASFKNRISLINTPTWNESQSAHFANEFITPTCFSPDKNLLAVTDGPQVSLLDAHTLMEKQRLTPREYGIGSIRFSPDGQLLATGSNAVRLWDLKTGEPTLVLWHNDERYAVVDTSVAFSPDGKQVAAAISSDDDYTVRIWDVLTGSEIKKFPGFDGPVLLAFSPDGRWLVLGGRNRARVRRWDLRNPDRYQDIQLR